MLMLSDDQVKVKIRVSKVKIIYVLVVVASSVGRIKFMSA